MNFSELGDLEFSNLPAMGITPYVPIIDRHSPLAYSVAQHVHWNLAQHRGIESCNRFSLQHCSIIQGMSLYKELALDCVWCARKKKKFLEASMGPISDRQLSIAPPFWCAQIDLFGPLTCYVPGLERTTRKNAQTSVKVWILTSVCIVTKIVNCQVLEKTDASGVLDGLTRLSCEVGVPSFILCDQGSNVIKALREVDVCMKNLKLQMFNEKGIKFDVCSVGGHNEHGLVERVIRSLQDSMEECGLKRNKLTATGLQTLCKLVENDLNNVPLGFKFSRDHDNTEVLKLITPNMMKLGRINTRALSCPLRLPHGASDMVEKVCKSYESWFKIWSSAYLPKIMFRPKWFKDEVDLKPGDIVYFPKSSDTNNKDEDWIVGMIADVERGRDGIIRKVSVKYRNANELQDRVTERSVRRICKLWSEDDWNLMDDLSELGSRLASTSVGQSILGQVVTPSGIVTDAHVTRHSDSFLVTSPDRCCCLSHCNLTHQVGKPLRSYQALNVESRMCQNVDFLLPTFTEPEVLDENVREDDLTADSLTGVLFSLNLA